MTLEKNLEGSPTDENNEGATPEQTDINSIIDTKFSEIEKKFNKALNNVVAKLTKPNKPETSPKDDSVETAPPESAKTSPDEATIKAIEAKYKKEVDALRKEIEEEKRIREGDRKETFKAKLESKALKTLSSIPDIDDPEGALEVFMLKHDIENFIPGSNGLTIYKTSEDDNGFILDDLIKDWMKTKIGKRFIKVTLPNGTGKDTPANENLSNQGKPKDLFAKKKAMKEGNIQLRF
jgi:hypothetical protein